MIRNSNKKVFLCIAVSVILTVGLVAFASAAQGSDGGLWGWVKNFFTGKSVTGQAVGGQAVLSSLSACAGSLGLGGRDCRYNDPDSCKADSSCIYSDSGGFPPTGSTCWPRFGCAGNGEYCAGTAQCGATDMNAKTYDCRDCIVPGSGGGGTCYPVDYCPQLGYSGYRCSTNPDICSEYSTCQAGCSNVPCAGSCTSDLGCMKNGAMGYRCSTDNKCYSTPACNSAGYSCGGNGCYDSYQSCAASYCPPYMCGASMCGGGTDTCVGGTASCDPSAKAPGCYQGLQRCGIIPPGSSYSRFVERCSAGGANDDTQNVWVQQIDCGAGNVCARSGPDQYGRYTAGCVTCDADGDGYVPAGAPYPCPQCDLYSGNCDCNDVKANDPIGLVCPTSRDNCASAISINPAVSKCAICIYPGATEVCDDGVDNDCNGKIDRQPMNEDPACVGDTTPPVSTFMITDPTSVPASHWYKSSVTYSITATDAGGSTVSGIYSCVDTTDTCDPEAENHGSSWVVTTEGENYVRYRAIDSASPPNKEEIRTAIIKIDKTSPITRFVSVPDGQNGWFKTLPVQVILECTDELSKCDKTFYRVDYATGPWIEYTEPFMINTERKHMVQYKSIDRAGNEEYSYHETNVWIDKTQPRFIGLPIPQYTNIRNFKVEGYVVDKIGDTLDEGSGVANLAINGEPVTFSSYDGKYTKYVLLSEGPNTITRVVTDKAGNPPREETWSIILDTFIPTTSINLVDADNDGFATAFTLSATDPPESISSGVDKIYYHIDNGADVVYPGGEVMLPVGRHNVFYHSVDKAGNVEFNRNQSAMGDACPDTEGKFDGCSRAIDLKSELKVIYDDNKRNHLSDTWYACEGTPKQRYQPQGMCKKPLTVGAVGDSLGENVLTAHVKVYNADENNLKNALRGGYSCENIYLGQIPLAKPAVYKEVDVVNGAARVDLPELPDDSHNYFVILYVLVKEPPSTGAPELSVAACKKIAVGSTDHPAKMDLNIEKHVRDVRDIRFKQY